MSPPTPGGDAVPDIAMHCILQIVMGSNMHRVKPPENEQRISAGECACMREYQGRRRMSGCAQTRRGRQ